MPDISDDAYLLEVMASTAALAFRPDPPKVSCKCEEKTDALIAIVNEMRAQNNKPEPWGASLAFGAGIAVGAAAILLGRRKR